MFKRIEVVAPWWLDKIKDMRCLRPGCMCERSDPHHLGRHRHRDDWCVPICRVDHTLDARSIHKIGEWQWMKENDVNLYEVLLNLLLPQFEQELRMRGG